jgi:hypothetical protein
MKKGTEELLDRIHRYTDEWDLTTLDEIAAAYTDSGADEAVDDDVRSALIDAYGYHYGQLAMDYGTEKYWSGGRAVHLEDLLDRLTRLISISKDPYHVIEKSRFLREQASLASDEEERRLRFAEALALLDAVLNDLDDSDPMATRFRAEMVEALAEQGLFRINADESLNRAADILERLLAETDETTFETVGSAMMYARRLPEYPAHPRLADLTARFDRWAEDRWTQKPGFLITWCSLYIILLYHRHTDSLFENWYARATQIPKVVTGAESELSKLSHDIHSLAADLIRKGEDEAGERCYLLSLDLETFLYRLGEDAGMAWRKLHFAAPLIAFYRERHRTSEAVEILREHLRFGREALRTHGSESSMHGQMSDLLRTGIELFDEDEKTGAYREIIVHLTKRIEALKEQFSDYSTVADRKVWSYLYYVYDDDYETLIRCHLMLGNREDAIRVLREWFSLDTRKREELDHSSVDWHQIAAKEEFAPVRTDLLRMII